MTWWSGYLTVQIVRFPYLKRLELQISPQEMDGLVEAHAGAEATGDVAAAVATYTDDIEHDVVGAPDGPLHGPDAAALR